MLLIHFLYTFAHLRTFFYFYLKALIYIYFVYVYFLIYISIKFIFFCAWHHALLQIDKFQLNSKQNNASIFNSKKWCRFSSHVTFIVAEIYGVIRWKTSHFFITNCFITFLFCDTYCHVYFPKCQKLCHR
jgi:uncharacterized membrane protein